MTQGYVDLTAPINAVIASGLMRSTCNIMGRPGTVDALGQVDMTNLVSVTGLQGLKCMFAVNVDLRPDISAVARLMDKFDTKDERHALLDGYYPTILQQHIAIVDGTSYEIMAVEHDSQHSMTRLGLRAFSL